MKTKNWLQPDRRHCVLRSLFWILSLLFVVFLFSAKGCRGFLLIHEQERLQHHHHRHVRRNAPYRSFSHAVCRKTSSANAFTLNEKQKSKSFDNKNDIFDEYFSENIAKDVSQNINVPFYIPEPIVTYLIEQAVTKLSTDLSNDTKTKLQELIQAQATPTSNDNFVEQEINDLSNRMAQEINPKIDVPVLDEDQELILLQQILMVILQSMTKDPKANLVQWTNTNIQVSRELLGGPASRRQLAKSIDEKMEKFKIPLPEAQRLALITQAVDSSADLLTRLLPPDLLETLKGESPEGLLKMKEYLIDSVNRKVDIVGIDETKERQLIETMVNVLIDEYVDETDAEFLLMAPEEQQERLQERKVALEREKTFAQRRYEREQASIDHKLVRVNERLKEIRKRKSFLRRLFGRRKK